MIKLNANQLEVLTLMNNGWELGRSMGFNTRAWLQKGGWGHGGETKDVHLNTFYALLNRQLIGEHYGCSHSTYTLYTLTEEAKGIFEAIERKTNND